MVGREKPFGVSSFNNFDVLQQSWYGVARSSEVRRGRVLARQVGAHRLALYRGQSGQAYALLSRCAHLGADLSMGQVQDDCLQCPFHHWTYAGDGRCVRIPSQEAIPPEARVGAWTVQEQYGMVWVWPGAEPAFPLPAFESGLRPHLLPLQRIRCHPNMLACNGLDVEHFSTVHRLRLVEVPQLSEPQPWQLALDMKIRLSEGEPWARALQLVAGPVVAARFCTWGGNMATIHADFGRFRLRVLFTHRPLATGWSLSQSFFFLAHAWQVPLAWLAMGPVLAGDRPLLEGLRFQPHLVASDAPLSRFMRLVERLPVL